ncbi:uncharacterized protein V1516DRAFT_681041 [Lipomyces oligophaga]|uniref:uncharacterized protein n=1 Tax=Lipomyces oligophaga TaxID=45792 RepID=UPI0034CF6A57
MAASQGLFSDRISQFLYRASLFLFIFFTGGFVIVTPADLISQARRKDQEYNEIIVIATYLVTGGISGLLALSRLYQVRLLMADIPKRFVPGRHELPPSCANAIESELQRCEKIRAKLLPVNTVEHAGMPPPWNEGRNFPHVPYVEVIIKSLSLLEGKACGVSPMLKRKPNMSVRDYVFFLQEYMSLDDEIVRKFVAEYEDARFSEVPIELDQFKDIMKTFTLLMGGVVLRPQFSGATGLVGYERDNSSQSRWSSAS